MAEPRHKSTARTFRLGEKPEAHIAEIVELLAALEERVVTDTDAVREALSHFAQHLRKKSSRKSPADIASGNTQE